MGGNLMDKKAIDAFNQIKNGICQSIGSIDPDRPAVIYTDASEDALGAVIMQVSTEGYEQPVAYYSYTLKGSERNWPNQKRKAKAIIKVIEKFWEYLRFHTPDMIEVKCDCQPVVQIFNKDRQEMDPELQRTKMALREKGIQVIHIPGKENLVADFLSRKEKGKKVKVSDEEVVLGQILDLPIKVTQK
jgi:hypothetical protein